MNTNTTYTGTEVLEVFNRALAEVREMRRRTSSVAREHLDHQDFGNLVIYAQRLDVLARADRNLVMFKNAFVRFGITEVELVVAAARSTWDVLDSSPQAKAFRLALSHIQEIF